METPYAYYNGKLGVKIKFLTTDRNHADSLMLISYRALRSRITRNSSSERELRRASLNMDALVEYNSLCREWKDSLAVKFGEPEKEAKRNWFAQHYVADRKAYDFFLAHRYGEKNEKKLDLKLVEQYTYDASVLNTVLKVKANRTAYNKALGVTGVNIWDSLSKDVNAFREVEHKLPATSGGLRRKVNNYIKGSYLSLVSGKLQNSNAKKVTKKEQMALLDELIGKHTNLDNELISTLYNAVAEKLDWKTITAGTVANRKERKAMVSHAGRKGVKSLKNNILMQVKRSRPSTPMLYWSVDGWDVELYYQHTVPNKDGKLRTTYTNRMTVVVILDTFNNYPIGYAIGTHETPQLIKEALRNAMQHSKELFGDLYKPYQMQTDNYGRGALTPLYEAVTDHFTPASIGNAKSKVIEPYFKHLNTKYCQLLNNWSGFGIASGSKRQPNDEYMNKIKKSYPDQHGVVNQIHSMINAERSKKQVEFSTNWLNTKEEYKSLMSYESYLLNLGDNNGHTSKLRGEGLGVTIGGEKLWFDSFDINFRMKAHLDWQVQYDQNDLSKVLAISTDGSERFILENKYIQPMAIADQVEGDTEELKRIRDYNKKAVEVIIEERAKNANILAPFLQKTELEGTLAKHLLTDSLGQHKNNKNADRLQANTTANKLIEKSNKKEEKKQAKTFAEEQLEYYQQKTNVNSYL